MNGARNKGRNQDYVLNQKVIHEINEKPKFNGGSQKWPGLCMSPKTGRNEIGIKKKKKDTLVR